MKFCPQCGLSGEAINTCINRSSIGCPRPKEAKGGTHIQVVCRSAACGREFVIAADKLLSTGKLPPEMRCKGLVPCGAVFLPIKAEVSKDATVEKKASSAKARDKRQPGSE